MSNPHVTFRDLLGQRIYSVETPAGFVHFVATEIFEHESEAVRAIKGVENPVVAAMAEQAKDAVIAQGDVSAPEDDRVEAEIEVAEPVKIEE